MQATLNDSTSALLHAVRGALRGPAGFAVEEVRSRGWASVTFAGARHELCFRLEGEEAEEAADGFVRGLDPKSFALPGHILADMALVSDERAPGCARIRIEALTVEERP
ncbi:MAG TPA: hypothetical protein VGB62_05540 [Allosphingosinicella sp.]|jgi:hypothetical protein